MLEIFKATENGMFSHSCAYSFSTADSFLNDFDFQSIGIILKCGRFDLQAGQPFVNSNDQAVSTFHSQGIIALTF